MMSHVFRPDLDIVISLHSNLVTFQTNNYIIVLIEDYLKWAVQQTSKKFGSILLNGHVVISLNCTKTDSQFWFEEAASFSSTVDFFSSPRSPYTVHPLYSAWCSPK